ncbi:MAG: hypothetical protein KF857_06495 [Fimbriimonadaceae bacterium]|nr:hypothetical protein [Fimbriimonadaceae bacterium]
MTGAEPDPAESLEWAVQFGDGQDGKRVVVVAVAVLAGLFAFAFLRNILASLLGVGAVLVSTAELFLPIRFTLDEQGARRKCGLSVVEVKWADVLQVVESEDGVRLSTVAPGSKLEPFRGVFLRFSGNRDAVLGKIRALQTSHADSVGQRTDA